MFRPKKEIQPLGANFKNRQILGQPHAEVRDILDKDETRYSETPDDPILAHSECLTSRLCKLHLMQMGPCS